WTISECIYFLYNVRRGLWIHLCPHAKLNLRFEDIDKNLQNGYPTLYIVTDHDGDVNLGSTSLCIKRVTWPPYAVEVSFGSHPQFSRDFGFVDSRTYDCIRNPKDSYELFESDENLQQCCRPEDYKQQSFPATNNNLPFTDQVASEMNIEDFSPARSSADTHSPSDAVLSTANDNPEIPNLLKATSGYSVASLDTDTPVISQLAFPIDTVNHLVTPNLYPATIDSLKHNVKTPLALSNPPYIASPDFKLSASDLGLNAIGGLDYTEQDSPPPSKFLPI
ncbi:hypothetical protein MMC22_011689, partial [Lobaria immixta]|nr:hypothetical protein [Lobaria immixta]